MRQETKEELLQVVDGLKNKASMYVCTAEQVNAEFSVGYRLLALELRLAALEITGIIKDA